MNTLTIILLAYVVIDIISNIILITLMKRKGIRLTDLAWRLKWLFKKETPLSIAMTEYWDDYYSAEEDDVDDQGYGY